MKFSDIDFGAISRMMDSMSDEEKAQLNNYAQNMMDDFKKQQASNEEEIDDDFYAFLHINEEDYRDLDGIVLDEIEAASDMEQFYDDTKDVDFSASALFFSKAILHMMRKYFDPVFKSLFKFPSNTTIYDYLMILMNDENIQKLNDEQFGDTQSWVMMRNFISQAYLFLNRAEYDHISYDDLQVYKDLLFKDKYLLMIKTIIC